MAPVTLKCRENTCGHKTLDCNSHWHQVRVFAETCMASYSVALTANVQTDWTNLSIFQQALSNLYHQLDAYLSKLHS